MRPLGSIMDAPKHTWAMCFYWFRILAYYFHAEKKPSLSSFKANEEVQFFWYSDTTMSMILKSKHQAPLLRMPSHCVDVNRKASGLYISALYHSAFTKGFFFVIYFLRHIKSWHQIF